MKQDCEYNPIRDVAEVDPFGYVDLCAAMTTNTIPNDLGLVENNYNEIEDPSTIVGKPMDNFDFLEAHKDLYAYFSKVQQQNQDKNSQPEG